MAIRAPDGANNDNSVDHQPYYIDFAGRSGYPITRGRETEGDGKNMQSTRASSESSEGQRHPSAIGEQ